jgi:DNA-binding PadR family transcriptional regulator
MTNTQKEVQVKLAKGLLDVIILQFLNSQPMHGYQIISQIRKSYGVYFGPSTIYPLLGTMEKKGYVTSEWNMENDRPRKVYRLTNHGQGVLDFTENSLSLIIKKIGTEHAEEVEQRNVSVQYFPNQAKQIPALTQR